MACSITFDVLLDSAIRILGIFHPYIEVLDLASTFTRGNYVSACYFFPFSYLICLHAQPFIAGQLVEGF